jgi:acyl carrier protein
VVNTLSSAETGTVSLYFVDMKISLTSERVPVGYPVEGVEIIILDDAGHPLDFNEIGEVAVRSRFLSGGYWQKPDVTSQRFISQSDDETGVMYLSGDLGCMSQDGCLHLFGRKDFQVKIRSFRVDVSEVETALKEYGEIRSVAVTGRNDQTGNTKLVAYVVSRSRPEPTVAALRLFLHGKLPEYMIPAEFVFLDELPLMSTGKINRRVLPEPSSHRPERAMPIVGPRTPIEIKLAEIWVEVLSVREVGIHNNFFDLGGHSLAASQVISRVIRTFNLELPVKALFDAPTVAEMAAIITQNQAKLASDAELAQMLREVEAMTEEEAQKQLAGAHARRTKGDGHE